MSKIEPDRSDDQGEATVGEAEAGESLLEILLAETTPPEVPAEAGVTTRAPGLVEPVLGVVIGSLAGLSPEGEPLVVFAGGAGPVSARALAPLSPDAIGREVALMFEGGALARPLVMGLIQRPAPAPPAEEAVAELGAARPEALDVVVDGRRITFRSEEEIVLACGKASITLTKAGKILIRGAYLLARSSGVNRIQGGSVQIN